MSTSNKTTMEKTKYSSSDTIAAYFSSIKYNIKLLFNLNSLAAILYVILVLMISSIRLLDYKALAVIGEQYFSIIGIILVPYLLTIEDKDNIKEVICCRKTAYANTIFLRIFIVMFSMLLIIFSIMIYAKLQGCSFKLWELTLGTWITAAFLGMIGFTVANLSHNISAAYLVSFGYYFIEYVTKGKYTKDLYLFSLTKGILSNGKLIILLITFTLMIVNLLIINKRSI